MEGILKRVGRSMLTVRLWRIRHSSSKTTLYGIDLTRECRFRDRKPGPLDPDFYKATSADGFSPAGPCTLIPISAFHLQVPIPAVSADPRKRRFGGQTHR